MLNITPSSLEAIIDSITDPAHDSAPDLTRNLFAHRFNAYEEAIYQACYTHTVADEFNTAIQDLTLLMDERGRQPLLDRLLLDCCKSNNIPATIFSLKIGADLRCQQDAPLLTVTSLGYCTLASLFIEAGLKASLVPSALIVALTHQQTEMVSILIDNGISPDMNHGEPLRRCCTEGLVSMVELLIQRGANPRIEDGRILEAAVTSNNSTIVDLLLAYPQPVPLSTLNQCIRIAATHDQQIYNRLANYQANTRYPC
ncbi:Hypothetical protein MVR_LOCUS90 [uncultured virus]|nr:Hypothetical protein MVR_LOCUS90 [uncultured virus]